MRSAHGRSVNSFNCYRKQSDGNGKKPSLNLKVWTHIGNKEKLPKVAQQVEKPPANAGDAGLIPGLGRSLGEDPVSLPGEFHGQRSLEGYSP